MTVRVAIGFRRMQGLPYVLVGALGIGNMLSRGADAAVDDLVRLFLEDRWGGICILADRFPLRNASCKAATQGHGLLATSCQPRSEICAHPSPFALLVGASGD